MEVLDGIHGGDVLLLLLLTVEPLPELIELDTNYKAVAKLSS